MMPAHAEGDQHGGHGDHESSGKDWSKIFMDHLPDWFVAFFTFVLCIFTGLLWWSTDKLWRAGEKQIAAAQTAADAALLSARAAIGLELPFLRVEPEYFGYGDAREQDGTRRSYCSLGKLSAVNNGKTRAFPVDLRCGWFFGAELPEEPTYQYSGTIGVDAIIEPNAPEPMEFFLRDLEMNVPQDFRLQLRDGRNKFWFYCCFAYLDFLNDRHEAGCCWRRIEWVGPGKFIVDHTPAYNRRT